MDLIDKAIASKITPKPEEAHEAAKHRGGWVYRIAGRFAKHQPVPPEAIIGAWRVGSDGRITSEFVPNPRYDHVKWPASNDR